MGINGKSGFVKLHRSMLGWEWYDDPNTFRVFVHILLRANYEDKRWHGIEIKRGQLLTSRAKLAKETRLSERAVRTALNHLKSTGELTIEATNQRTLVTVANYDVYQSDSRKATSKVTSKSTNERPTSDQRPTTTQEYKEREEYKRTLKNARARGGGFSFLELAELEEEADEDE